MKRLALALTALLATSPSLADDPKAFSWTGFYAGLNATYQFGGNADYDYLIAGNYEPVGRVRPTDLRGFLGGFHVGSLYHLPGTPLVGGFELASSYGKLENTLTENPPPAGNDYRTMSKASWLARGGPRIGFAFDRFFAYGSGGYAMSQVDFSATFYNKDGPGGTNGSQVRISDKMDVNGWYYGGGLEMHVGHGWIIGLEYLHFDFKDVTAVLLTTNSGILSEKVHLSYDSDQVTLRAGYKFPVR